MGTTPSPDGVSPKRTIPPYVAPSSGGGGGSADPLVLEGLVAGEAIAVGELVRYATNGRVMRARALPGECVVIGAAKTASAASGDAIDVYIAGAFPMVFTVAPGAIANGVVCYLSATLGAATLARPTLGPNVAWVMLGVVMGADGNDTTPQVLRQTAEIIYGA